MAGSSERTFWREGEGRSVFAAEKCVCFRAIGEPLGAGFQRERSAESDRGLGEIDSDGLEVLQRLIERLAGTTLFWRSLDGASERDGIRLFTEPV